MENESSFYTDPNAFIRREPSPKKEKVDLCHIERSIYPINYEQFPEHFDRNIFKNPHPPEQPRSKFNLGSLLPLLMKKNSDLSSLLPSLLSSLGMGNEIMPLLNNISKPKKVEARVVENFDNNSISNYERVE